MLQRLRRIFVEQVLGLDDTPQRIALGAFLGTLVGFTPTFGVQLALYVALATLCKANKLSGIPFTFVNTPFTIVPMYWLNWRVGALLLHGPGTIDAAAEAEMLARFTQSDTWSSVGEAVLAINAELWMGSLVVGSVVGLPAYFFTLTAVRAYRQRRGPALTPVEGWEKELHGPDPRSAR